MIGKLILAILLCGSLGFSYSPSEPQAPPVTAWIEAIDVYELPWDPAWEKAAVSAAGSLIDKRNDQAYVSWFRKTAEDLATRRKNAGDNDRSRDAIVAFQKSLAKTLVTASKKRYPLSVVRCWDGVEKRERVLVFGNGQRASRDKLKVGVTAEAELEQSKPGDDFQGQRTTAAIIRVATNPPSDYARFAQVDTSLKEFAFGEIDPIALTSPVTKTVEKSRLAGSGALEFSFSANLLPSEIQLERGYPWYLEFRLYELDQNGKRVREAAFTGSQYAVAIPGDGAVGRVQLKKPAPWGYEMEVVRWFGVADKSKLLPSKKGNVAPAAPTSDDATTEPEPTADEPTKIPADGAPPQPSTKP